MLARRSDGLPHEGEAYLAHKFRLQVTQELCTLVRAGHRGRGRSMVAAAQASALAGPLATRW